MIFLYILLPRLSAWQPGFSVVNIAVSSKIVSNYVLNLEVKFR